MLIKSLNNSITPPGLFIFSTPSSIDLGCFISNHSNIVIAFFITYTLITFPLCFLVLHQSLRDGKQRHSSSSVSVMSHSDCFTYHTIALELVGVFGCILCSTGICRNQFNAIRIGVFLWFYSWYGETFFHTLTCLEHYLAVVHPITYIKLRSETAVRVRNIVSASVWLLCFLGLLTVMIEIIFISANLAFMACVLITVSFCNLSVLYVLIRPKPGGQQGDREYINQSKKRAFYTILILLGVLVLRFLGSLVWTVVFALKLSNTCFIIALVIWCTLPSSVVKPLLFLHRAGKSVCFQMMFK